MYSALCALSEEDDRTAQRRISLGQSKEGGQDGLEAVPAKKSQSPVLQGVGSLRRDYPEVTIAQSRLAKIQNVSSPMVG